MICTHKRIVIVDATSSTEVLCYASRMEAVCALMENTAIAPNPEYYASSSHEEAVRKIRDHCDVVLKAIKADQEEQAALERGEEKCEGCGKPATTSDGEGVPLCEECAKTCDDSPNTVVRDGPLGGRSL